MCRTSPFVCALVALLAGLPAISSAAEREFATAVAPLLKKFCVDCHGDDGPEGQVSLTRMSAEKSVADSYKNWGKVAAMIEGQKMPPKDSDQPSAEERRKLVD